MLWPMSDLLSESEVQKYMAEVLKVSTLEEREKSDYETKVEHSTLFSIGPGYRFSMDTTLVILVAPQSCPLLNAQG